MKKIFALISLFLTQLAIGQEVPDLSYYLPAEVNYQAGIPTPKEVIGHEVGAWHVTHDKLIQYMKALAESSDRVIYENRGSTYEDRPLAMLTISSPANLARLEAIRKDHIAATEGENTTADRPVVVYQGFSVHGNEPSGSNAALAYAYYLAAAQGAEIEAMLNDVVILLDPSFNPDGLQRFSYWANTNKSMQLNPDNNEREYHEVWPGGRTNHYWFDINRDWLPVQLPESQARIRTFHNWLPNILTDHHEMGTNSTFFFQPGEPARVHPLTPGRNQELTAEIGTYHADALDKIGSLYYSEENYDDYYYGKGSTFPDVNGSIGILFEQASSRGHMQQSENGILTFPFTIRNQFTTALSTLKAAYGMRKKLLDYQADFYAQIRNAGSKSASQSYIFGDPKDSGRSRKLAEVLFRHNFELELLEEDTQIDGKSFKKGSSYLVPAGQKNPRLLQAMFERRTTFTDSLFYDISAWTFPLAFNLDVARSSSIRANSSRLDSLPALKGGVSGKSNYAYLFEWHEYYTPKALNRILNKGLRAKVAKSPFSLEGKNFDYGTIMIPVANQDMNGQDIYEFLNDLGKETGINIVAVSTGLTQGIDLGSNEMDPLKRQKVALIVGPGIRSYDAGEIWHLFDIRYEMQITKIGTEYLMDTDLSSYTDIIVPGMYGSKKLGAKEAEKLQEWVKNGGTLIGYRDTANWMEKNKLLKTTFRKDSLVASDVSFAQKDLFLDAQRTSGAIFEVDLDLSHPINYGYTDDKLAVFRNTNIYLDPDKDSYNNPIQYTTDPLLSGYISEEKLELLKNSVPFKVQRLGKGRVILFTDNTNFRAFWLGTNKLLMNAVFFGPLM